MLALRTAPVAIRLILAAIAALVTIHVAENTLHFMPPGLSDLTQKFAGNAVFSLSALVCVLRAWGRPGERVAWLLMGLGLALWEGGLLYFTLVQWDLDVIPMPSWADAGYLLFYLPTYAALALLYRSRARGVSRSLWIDGAIGFLAVAAIAAAIVFQAVLDATGGSVATVATNLSYPLADLLMLALVVGVVVMTGWRRAGAWAWIAGGLVLFSISDSFYLYGISVGSYTPGVIYDCGWPAAVALLAFGAWTPATAVREERRESRRAILLPIVFALTSLGLLISDHFHRTNGLALVLSSLCLLAVLARLVITFSDNLRMLTRSRVEAGTDALTGLANRRALTRDLELAVTRASVAQPVYLALFDLDGFKVYNDTFGHPAGDSLLTRLGAALEHAVGTDGTTYRMGGDEFCVLTNGDHGNPDVLLAHAAAALSEGGEGFAIGCSFGTVQLPVEAADAEHALNLADARMYAEKTGGRVSAERQSSDVLMRALAERLPSLGDHVHLVAEFAVAIGTRLGLSPEDLQDVGRAAELHDIGKLAIPDAILNKPLPLDPAEWAFMRRHTLIGERILNAAPALQRVAGIVRSTHEQIDGRGYPDKLAGDAIPLTARIVLVCDAFEAMTADRSYRKAMSTEVAIEELTRCAGTQFDPDVVAALCEITRETAVLSQSAAE
jgi:diguanylate cyclase (GGDEF)-like protein